MPAKEKRSPVADGTYRFESITKRGKSDVLVHRVIVVTLKGTTVTKRTQCTYEQDGNKVDGGSSQVGPMRFKTLKEAHADVDAIVADAKKRKFKQIKRA